MASWVLSLLLVVLVVGVVCEKDVEKEAKMAPGFHVDVFYELSGARFRGMKVLPGGAVLVVKADNSNGESTGQPDISGIQVVADNNWNGIADTATQLIPPEFRLSHGIEYLLSQNVMWREEKGEKEREEEKGKGMILASNKAEVWGWGYNEGEEEVGEGQLLIVNINASDSNSTAQGHWTRTLRLSPDQRYLFVSVGSQSNVDPNSFRARIRRFDLQSPDFYSNLPYDFADGEVFADGLRNTVGTAFDKDGVLWGGDVGADDLYREDLGGDIHNGNPGEELNKLGVFNELEYKFYGYPYCWSEYNLSSTYDGGLGKKTLWAWPTTMDEKDDDWCRQNSLKSELVMQPHSTPLGLTFYNYTAHQDIDACPDGVAFPRSQDGDAYVALHGSWNSDVPVGYKVVHIPFTIPGGKPTGEILDLMKYQGPGAVWPDNVRPVDVTFDMCGRLLVSDDAGGRIFTIYYKEPSQKDEALSPIWFILIGYNCVAIIACVIAIVWAQIKQNREDSRV